MTKNPLGAVILRLNSMTDKLKISGWCIFRAKKEKKRKKRRNRDNATGRDNATNFFFGGTFVALCRRRVFFLWQNRLSDLDLQIFQPPPLAVCWEWGGPSAAPPAPDPSMCADFEARPTSALHSDDVSTINPQLTLHTADLPPPHPALLPLKFFPGGPTELRTRDSSAAWCA